MKKEREKKTKAKRNQKKQLNRKEKAKARSQVVATVQVLVAKPGENLFKGATRGRPSKESPETVVLNKLNLFTAAGKKFLSAQFAALLDQISAFVKGGGDQKEIPRPKEIDVKVSVPTKRAIKKAADEKAAEDATDQEEIPIPKEIDVKVSVPTKRAIKKAADKKAAEDATMKAVAEAADRDKQPAPEESLPKIHEPKEEEVIVAAVLQLGPLEKEVDRLKVDLETLTGTTRGVDAEGRLLALERVMEEVRAKAVQELESGETKAVAAEVLERRLLGLEHVMEEVKAKAVQELESGETKAVAAKVLEKRLLDLERLREFDSRKARDRTEKVESIVQRLWELEEGEKALGWRLRDFEEKAEEAKAKEVAKPETIAIEKAGEEQSVERRLLLLERQVEHVPQRLAQLDKNITRLASLAHEPYHEEAEAQRARKDFEDQRRQMNAEYDEKYKQR